MSFRNNEKAQAYLQKKKVPELFEVSLSTYSPANAEIATSRVCSPACYSTSQKTTSLTWKSV